MQACGAGAAPNAGRVGRAAPKLKPPLPASQVPNEKAIYEFCLDLCKRDAFACAAARPRPKLGMASVLPLAHAFLCAEPVA